MAIMDDNNFCSTSLNAVYRQSNSDSIHTSGNQKFWSFAESVVTNVLLSA